MILASLALCLSLADLLPAHESGFPEKTLKSVFPDATVFTARKKSLTAAQVKRIEQSSGSKLHANDNPVNFYVAVGKAADNSGVLGMVLLVDTKGPKGAVDLAIGVKRDLTISKVVVVENRDEPALAAAAFLDQFKGKGATAPLAVGKDLKYSGVAASGEALASAVRRGIQLLAEASKP
jgi:Na+-translocating ferredoxin:NAD+ oxidoreductase RnfG subunit